VGVEVDLGLDAQNQYGVARDGQLQRSDKVSPNVDGVVRTRGNTRPALNARVVDDLNVRFLHPHRLGRTRPDTREAGHTFIRVDFELHAIIRLAVAAITIAARAAPIMGRPTPSVNGQSLFNSITD
jgi:hypothetical protein